MDMRTETEADEGRDSDACRRAGRRVLTDPDLWAVVVILLAALAMLT